MTIADEPKNQNPAESLSHSLGAISALRASMEKRLREAEGRLTASTGPAASHSPLPDSLKDIQNLPTEKIEDAVLLSAKLAMENHTSQSPQREISHSSSTFAGINKNDRQTLGDSFNFSQMLSIVTSSPQNYVPSRLMDYDATSSSPHALTEGLPQVNSLEEERPAVKMAARAPLDLTQLDKHPVISRLDPQRSPNWTSPLSPIPGLTLDEIIATTEEVVIAALDRTSHPSDNKNQTSDNTPSHLLQKALPNQSPENDQLLQKINSISEELTSLASPRSGHHAQPQIDVAPPREQEKQKTSTDENTAPKKSANPTQPESPLTEEWPRVLFRIADRSFKIVTQFMERLKGNPKSPFTLDPAHLGQAFYDLFNRILNDPERFADAQLALWQGYLKVWQSTLARLQGKEADPVVEPLPGDKRFQDDEWRSNWIYDYLKQSYLFTSNWVHNLVHEESKECDPKLIQKLDFYTQQLIDAVSPSNFWMTNPEVLRKTIESGGDNLVKGLENLLDDLEQSSDLFRINMANQEVFEVGRNLAITPGKVIFENNLIQLIQYQPQTETVKQTPMLIVPPWINKYYVLDLRPKNSLINYLVSQGHTVFCISWVNPGLRHALINFDDYMSEGILAALTEITKRTNETEINVTGYCIGGTALACALAYLKAAPNASSYPTIKSATYLVTMIDFSEPGDIGVFIDEEQVEAIEARMAKQGYLDAQAVATSFNMLRANDLIWSFVVNKYLLGKEPFPFDILYWNADSTNLPAVMQSYYLRRMYLANKLIVPNALKMKDVPINISRITTPSFVLATHDDHIAPWRSTYAATQIYQGPTTFVLGGSGHIAGVINPPSAEKYCYWTNEKCPTDPEIWFREAQKHNGSWWPEWLKWLEPMSGQDVPARMIEASLDEAPGTYVKVRAV